MPLAARWGKDTAYVDRAFLIERATVEPDGLGRLAVRHVQDQVGIEECPRGKRDLVSACRLFLRNQDNLDARSRKPELSSCFLFVRAMARGLSLNAKARRTLELHRERQTGGGRRSAAGAKPVSRSSHAKGLRCQACAYLSEVVTQIQLGGSRTDSLVRIPIYMPSQADCLHQCKCECATGVIG